MRWIYLSPHYDDPVLSCGGLIWEQARMGAAVEIWTIFAGNPPPGPLSDYAQHHHDRWGVAETVIALRRGEDQAACAAVGAVPRYFDLPDCIYRRLPDGEPVIRDREDLFGPVHPGEQELISFITATLEEHLRPHDRLVCPLGVGGHVDHRIVRAAVDSTDRQAWFYADYPYTIMEEFNFRLENWVGASWRRLRHPLSPGGLSAWQAGVAAHRSQISTFWADLDEMRAAIASYAATGLGSTLWQAPKPPPGPDNGVKKAT